MATEKSTRPCFRIDYQADHGDGNYTHGSLPNLYETAALACYIVNKANENPYGFGVVVEVGTGRVWVDGKPLVREERPVLHDAHVSAFRASPAGVGYDDIPF